MSEESSKALRVLMLGWEDPDHIQGGLGVASSALAEALASHVDLTYWFPSFQRGEASGDGFRALRIPVPLPSYGLGLDHLGEDLRRAWDIYTRTVIEEGLRTQPDLIHAHDWMTFPAAGTLAKALDIPLVYHVHSLASDREALPSGTAWSTEQEWLPRADLILTVSNYSSAELVDRLQIDPDRIHVLRHGVPAIHPYRSKKPFSGHLVVFLGRMTWQKGPQHFLNMAFALHEQQPETRFVMAGDGDLWGDILRQIARSRRGLRIQAPGMLSRDETYDLLSMADLLVMTSESEPLGLVALEATHFGVPVILPPRCGATELLPEAVVVDPHDATQLLKAVTFLLDHPKTRKTAVTRNQAAIAQLSWKESVQQLLHTYAPLIV